MSNVVILIADSFDAAGIEELIATGSTVHVMPEVTADDLAETITACQPSILIVRSTKVREDAINASTTLSLIVRAGAGYDTIDITSASNRGVFVANCPGKNSIAVAELAWGHILGCDRRLADQAADLRDGRWKKKTYAKARGLHGRTLGILGYGRIGREVARRGKAFGMTVAAWSRSLSPEQAGDEGVRWCATPLDLAACSDVVSIHVASTPQTRGLVDGAFLEALGKNGIIVNTSRGDVIDEAALTSAIAELSIRAGLDVFGEEPSGGDGPFDSSLAGNEGITGTHHVGASTDQAQEAIADEAVRIVTAYLTEGTVPNCVNRAEKTPARCLLTIRHLNRPGVLADAFRVIGESSINVEEMENIIYESDEAACARIQLSDSLDENQLADVCHNPNILTATQTPISQS